MKSFNIVATSPVGSKLTFYDVVKFQFVVRNNKFDTYEVFVEAEVEPVGLIPGSWAIQRTPGTPPVTTTAGPFKPFVVNPADVTGPTC